VAADHRRLHEVYRPDDQAIERAVTLHRSRNPAANRAAEPIAIYDLQRPEALSPDEEALGGPALTVRGR
jgi:hypothetical protein